MTDQTKRCPHCKRTRPIAVFSLRHRGGNRRQSWCHSCINETRRARYALRKDAS